MTSGFANANGALPVVSSASHGWSTQAGTLSNGMFRVSDLLRFSIHTDL